MVDIKDLVDTSLLPDEEARLIAYRPAVRTKYVRVGPEPVLEEGQDVVVDNRPVEVIIEDNRNLEVHRLYAKKILKKQMSLKLFKKFPLHKQLNFNDLDPDEYAYYKAIKDAHLAEYESMKVAIQACDDCDELDALIKTFEGL